ncbi:hypothetical protein N7517_001564 [Penicillium concentricum]|uniref:NACHT domain-containing protein n=1 Tax=Penicillium concentricum TaxID=293559 RepID=A0A9W9SW73_9EURO|nr:uncharacterized protein N7517_001564 [Penicillium concentricum]KAJ5383653.1 hypothetical protein N7517_001564 [Penicillium concentricum]
MSFGFGVGDFLAVLKLANTVRKQFKDAPSQFKSISDDVKLLSNVLRDIEDEDPSENLQNAQKAKLNEISRSCTGLLGDLHAIINKYQPIDKSSAEPRGIKNIGDRVWKRLNWDQKEIHDFRQRLSTNIDSFNLFLTRITKQVAITTQHGVTQLLEYQDTQQHENCLEWLSSLDHDAKQADFFSRVQEGTGKWLLTSTEFNKWVSLNDLADQQLEPKTAETHRTLFCPGIPGAGKTFLSSIVINHLQQILRPNDVALAFFFCNFREKVTLEEMLGSLLKQFVRQQPSIPQYLVDPFRRRASLVTSDFMTCLKSMFSTFSKVFLVIDALDECDLPDNLRTRFLSELRALQHDFNLRVFATSRDDQGIPALFEGCARLQVRASPEDVKRFLAGRVGILPAFVQKRSDLQEEIITEISTSIDGMFLLARLHIDSLQGKRSPKLIRQALKTLPKGLDAAYVEAMSRIENQHPDEVETAKDVLCWISCATRPLTPLELQHALAIEDDQPFLDEDNVPDIEDLVSVCAGLVTFDEQSGVVRLVHYTMQDFFDRTKDSLFPGAHHKIATRCISYLSFDVFSNASVEISGKQYDTMLRENPLTEYSAENLRYHIHQQEIDLGLVSRLFRGQWSFYTLLYVWERDAPWSHNLTTPQLWAPLYIRHLPKARLDIYLAACLDLVQTMKTILEDDAGDTCDFERETGLTPLWCAALYDSWAVVDLLLNFGAYPSAQQFIEFTPLMVAIHCNHTETAQLLIGSGANINDEIHHTESEDHEGIDIPLLLAIARRNEVLVRCLVERGVIIEPRGSRKHGPLDLAALHNHDAIFDFLFEVIDRNSSGSDYHFLLCCAAMGGREHIVTRLLERDDLSAEWKVSCAQNALYGLSSCGPDYNDDIPHDAVLKILLGLDGVDVNFQFEGKGLLHRSIGRTSNVRTLKSTIATTKLLYQHGADQNIKNKDGQSCLVQTVASDLDYGFKFRLEIAKFLLDTNGPQADLESQDHNGRTPLHLAVMSMLKSYECQEIVRLLLGKGANPNSRDNTDRTPLSYAAELSLLAIPRLLLASDANVDDKDSAGRTPLSYAVGCNPQKLWGHHDKHLKIFAEKWPPNSLGEAVEILLSKGADPNSRDHDGMTPLLRAEKNLPEDHEVVKKLRSSYRS